VADLRLEPGRASNLVGASGSGKSLLAHALMGTLPAELQVTGRARFGDDVIDLASREVRRRWGREIALLPQEPVLALDPTMRVRDQVAEGHPRFGCDRAGARRAAEQALAGVRLAGRGAAHPHTLSGGMAQRVAFAATTIGGAPVLLADEPSKGLDREARDELAGLLRAHLERGGTVLTITHDLDLARSLGGEVAVMFETQVVERGPADEVLERPTHPYTRRLVAADPTRWAHPWAHRSSPCGDRQRLVTGEDLTLAFPGSEPLFEGLELHLDAGDRVAVRGPSGVGKSTLADVVLRLRPPDRGRVTHAPELGAGRLQKLYQDPTQAFPSRVPLAASLGDVVRRHRRPSELLRRLFDELGLGEGLLARRPGQVSGGELQRIAIARAGLLDPRVLVADEPTSRLDLVTQEETMAALMRLLDRGDRALLLVTHDPALADAMTDRDLVLGGDPGGVRRSVG
jgi:peptide/nickel transport system ATP-binding protein